MRLDKLTTKFQQALADAQSLAVAHDNPYIEPPHLLAAMLRQDDGPQALLAARRRQRRRRCSTALEAAIDKLPQVQGGGSRSQVGRDLGSLLQAAEKEASKRGDQFIASELFLLALADDKGDIGRLAARARARRARRSKRRSRRCAAARRSTAPRPRASARR